MNDEFERMWEEMVVAYLKILSSHVALGAEENNEKP
jgi:hypothetical protein